MADAARTLLTAEEYLVMEQASETKHEFVAGDIYAMAGVSRQHDRIVFNLGGMLYANLAGSPCRGHTPEMRVGVMAANAYFYPDLSLSCGEALYEDAAVDTLLNPVVVFEVLSPSTERHDRGRKFRAYQKCDSISEIVLISQFEIAVEQYTRGADGQWGYRLYSSPDEQLTLTSIDCSLPISDIYRDVKFEPERPEQAAG
jgi:Uma2 family endonuclease